MQAAVYGLQALATVGSTVSQVRAGNAAAVAGEKEAQSERLAAQYNVGLERYKNQQILGKQRAVMGASGLDVSPGSLQDLALESARQAAMDEAAITYGGEVRAEQARYQGKLAQSVYRQRGISSGVAGMSTLVSNYYGKYGGDLSTKTATPLSNSSFGVPEFRYSPLSKPFKFTIAG